MNQYDMEELQEKREQEQYNAITNKKKIENQNQTHNIRKEGLQPINQKK